MLIPRKKKEKYGSLDSWYSPCDLWGQSDVAVVTDKGENEEKMGFSLEETEVIKRSKTRDSKITSQRRDGCAEKRWFCREEMAV